ncbi:MAG: flagellar hook-length control protein FliK, partial [Thiotrichaceae bacterium]|nr:flagellar hook-length control protein FliK [Thiotrichaceae bacterium]
MKTETLLNIRPEVPKGDESNARQALSQNSGAIADADSFKSALMQQVDQHKAEHNKADKSSEVALPADGNTLPNQENISSPANENNAEESSEQLVLAEQQAKEALVVLPEQDIALQEVLAEQNNAAPRILPEQANAAQVILPEQVKVAEVVLSEQLKETQDVLAEQSNVAQRVLPEQSNAAQVILPEQANAAQVILAEQSKTEPMVLAEQSKMEAMVLAEQSREARVVLPDQARTEQVILPEQARATQLDLPEQSRVKQSPSAEQIEIEPPVLAKEPKTAVVSEQNLTRQERLTAQEPGSTLSPVVLAKVFNDKLQNIPQKSNEILSDKKKLSEVSSGHIKPDLSIPAKQIAAEGGLNQEGGQTSDRKNEQALGRHLSEFQQYMETSRKHAQSGETIARVKNFDESLKVSQENIQALRGESKSVANNAQNVSTNQSAIAMQTMLTDRTLLTNGLTSFSALQTNAQNLTSMEVKTSVGNTGWNQGFSNQITMMVKNGIQQAKIKLNPAHLGPVSATVNLTAEAVVVNLSALQLNTKDAMENAIPRLKEMLNENGFSQVDVNVSQQDKQEQQGAALSSKN